MTIEPLLGFVVIMVMHLLLRAAVFVHGWQAELLLLMYGMTCFTVGVVLMAMQARYF